ncbi:hypothetical protein D3C72_2180330 [compost metagenome]
MESCSMVDAGPTAMPTWGACGMQIPSVAAWRRSSKTRFFRCSQRSFRTAFGLRYREARVPVILGTFRPSRSDAALFISRQCL